MNGTNTFWGEGKTMARSTQQKVRWQPPWKVTRYVILHNTSDQNVLLHLPTGLLRVEKGRKVLVTPDIAELPEVQHYIRQGKLVVEENQRK